MTSTHPTNERTPLAGGGPPPDDSNASRRIVPQTCRPSTRLNPCSVFELHPVVVSL